jgi:hypothetical protein
MEVDNDAKLEIPEPAAAAGAVEEEVVEGIDLTANLTRPEDTMSFTTPTHQYLTRRQIQVACNLVEPTPTGTVYSSTYASIVSAQPVVFAHTNTQGGELAEMKARLTKTGAKAPAAPTGPSPLDIIAAERKTFGLDPKTILTNSQAYMRSLDTTI